MASHGCKRLLAGHIIVMMMMMMMIEVAKEVEGLVSLICGRQCSRDIFKKIAAILLLLLIC